jgi:ubiquinone/menaquinone biosynthesis C-methylase UbiE
MDHDDHVNLLRKGVPAPGGTWADLGAGTGAFTLALAELLGPHARIHAVDLDRRTLAKNAEAMARHFRDVPVSHHVADFTGPLELPILDGIVIANALHFVRSQEAAVRHIRGALRPGGRLLIVEYNIERWNFAVPHPLPYTAWERLAAAAGFERTELLHRRPSSTLREIYSAASW